MKEFKNVSSFSTQIQEMSNDELLAQLSDYENKLEKLMNKQAFKEIKKEYEEYLSLPKSVRKQYEEITKKLQIAKQLASYYDRVDENLYEMYILGSCDHYYVGSDSERKQAHDKVILLAREREILERDYPTLAVRYAQPKIPATVGTVFTNVSTKINIIKEELRNRNQNKRINK